MNYRPKKIANKDGTINASKLSKQRQQLIEDGNAYLVPGGRVVLTYEFWEEIRPRAIRDEPCQLKAPYVLCEEKFKVFYTSKKTPQELSTSVPSLHSVPEALTKGQFVYMDAIHNNIDNLTLEGNRKIMALPSIVATVVKSERPSILYLNTSDLSQVLTKEMLQATPLFDCQAEFTEELLPYSLVCDHRVDCSTGRDEAICGQNGYRRCQEGETACTSGQCIPKEGWCDLFPDCVDGSDEKNCRGSCKHFRCMSEKCIPRSMVMDGEQDCTVCKPSTLFHQDMPFDEVGAHRNGFNDKVSIIGCLSCNRTQCLTKDLILQKEGFQNHCTGPEGRIDKVLRNLEGVSCYPQDGKDDWRELVSQYRTQIWAPRCVYLKDIYDNMIGCTDFFHLLNCENYTCPEGYYKCHKSFCIPLHYLRNQIPDCPNGDDENIPHIAENSNFECLSKGDNPPVLLHPSLVCEGHSHCPHGDDELYCDVTCSDGFLCVGGATVATDKSRRQILSNFSFIDSRTKYLDLSGLKVPNFFLRFPRHHLLNVMWLNLSNCEIDNLDMGDEERSTARYRTYGNDRIDLDDTSYVTSDLATVMTLDLSHNLLTGLDSGNDALHFNALGAMTNLQNLNLSHNGDLIVTISGLVNVAEHIVNLDLSFTAVSELTKEFMAMFTSLRVLSLEGTQISSVEPVFPTTLQVIDLRSIPLEEIAFQVFDGLTGVQQLSASSYKLCCSQVRGRNIPAHACSANDVVISSCDDLVQEPILRVLLWVFGSAALVGNVIVVIYRVTVDKVQIKRGYGIFVLNLSMSDFLMGIYLLLIAYTDLQYRGEYVWYEKAWRESWSCRIAGFLSTWSCESSAMFIFLITLDRFLVIRFPFGQVRLSSTGYIIASAVAWVAGLLLAILPLLPPFRHWSIYSSSAMCVGLPLTRDRASGWEYSTVIFVGINLFMFILIACGQVVIYRTMSSARMEGEASMSKFQYMRRQQDMAVAKQLSLVVISDFLCWFPIGAMGIMSLSGSDVGNEVYAWTAVLVLPINSAINPVLYTVPALKKTLDEFVNKLFDKGFSGSLKGMKQQELKPAEEGENFKDYGAQLKCLIVTMNYAKDFLENEQVGQAQIIALRSQYSALNSKLEEVKKILSIKYTETVVGEETD